MQPRRTRRTHHGYFHRTQPSHRYLARSQTTRLDSRPSVSTKVDNSENPVSALSHRSTVLILIDRPFLGPRVITWPHCLYNMELPNPTTGYLKTASLLHPDASAIFLFALRCLAWQRTDGGSPSLQHQPVGVRSASRLRVVLSSVLEVKNDVEGSLPRLAPFAVLTLR